MISKFLKIPGLLCVSILFMLACGGVSDEQSVEIRFWAMGAEGEKVKNLMPEFGRLHPHINVKVQMFPWTAAQEKLITAFASDNLPDVFQLGNTWIPQFVALDALVNLDPRIKRTDKIKPKYYFDGIWSTNAIADHMYGIPWYVDTRVLFYRSDILRQAGFRRPPRTWQELLRQCHAIKNILNENQYPIFLPTNEWSIFVIFALQNGAEILDSNHSYGAFSDSNFKEAFTFLMQFYEEELTPLSLSEVSNVHQAFAEGYINMYISGPWNIPEFKEWMDGALTDKWKTAPLPGKNDYPGVSLAGGSSLVMSSKSKHKQQAWELIQYLARPSVQFEFYRLSNDLPARKETWGNPVFKNDPHMNAFYLQFQNVHATPKVPEWEQIAFSKIQQYAELAARNVLSVDECLQRLDADVNNILEKRRWLLKQRISEESFK